MGEVCEGSEIRKAGWVVGWQGGKGGRILTWQGGRILVLLKSGGRRLGPIIKMFVSGVTEQNEGAGYVQDFPG